MTKGPRGVRLAPGEGEESESEGPSYDTSGGVIACILNTYTANVLVTASLGFALFGHSIWNLSGIPDDPGNVVLDVLMSTVTVLFVIEIIMQLIAFPDYAGSFFFWMDLIGTASMVFEVSFLFGSSGHLKLVALSNNAAITRTARAARLGARAVRFLRIVKAMNVVTTGGNKKQFLDTHDGDQESKSVAEKLALTLSEKVSLLTILLVCVMPLLHFDQYPVEDYSMKAWAERLESSYARTIRDGGGKDFMTTVDALESFYKGMNYYPYQITGFNEQTQVDGKMLTISGQQRFQGQPAPVRREYVVQVHVPVGEVIRPECDMTAKDAEGPKLVGAYNAARQAVADRTQAALLFNFESVVKMSAAMDIVTIALVLVVMIYFSHDVSKSLAGIIMKPMPGFAEGV